MASIGLAPLFYRIADQAHAAQLPRDIDTRNIGLEIRPDLGNVHPAGRRAENQGYGVGRASGLAGAVAYAGGGRDQVGAVIDKAKYAFFRAGLYAGATTQAAGVIDNWVQ